MASPKAGDSYLMDNGAGGFRYACYDPRDPSQKIDDSSTWKVTKNAALLNVAFIRQYSPDAPIDWDAVARLADEDDKPPPGR